MSTDRLTVANVLEQIAALLEFRQDNPFRIRAFRTAAKAIMGLPGSVAEALDNGSLAATRGIGPATVAIAKEFLESGRSELLEQLRREIPPGLLELLEVPGLGMAKIRQLHAQLKIQNLRELEAAARDGRLAALKGFGDKTADKILKGIAFVERSRAFQLWPDAAREAEVLRSALEALPGITRALTAGEVRRRCEVVGELAFVVESELAVARLRDELAGLPGLEQLAGAGARGLGFRSASGTVSGVLVAPPSELGAALVQATGSAAHLAELAGQARPRGYSLEEGILRRAGRPVAAPDEASLYQTLGVPLLAPELRELGDELARAGDEPWELIERSQLVGLLHCHTTYSDGTLGVEAMAMACYEAGYAYLGVTDHSRSAGYAGGMSEEAVRRQWDEIDALNARLQGIRILKGVESDILGDGRLDYDDALLAGFDFVIGSVHGRLGLGAAEMTARLLAALGNPYLTILGHPTGRQLLSRGAYAFDAEQVFAAAAAAGVALEINGDPHRLDLDWRLVRHARALGARFAIGADAHGRAGLGYVEFGLGMARKGGLGKADLVNARPVDGFLEFATARRR